MTEEKKSTAKKAAPKKPKAPKKPSAAEKKALAAAEEAQKQLADREAEFAEMKQDVLYQRAELENFKRRTKERFDESVRYAAEKVVNDLLPVIDNLERAMEHTGENGMSAEALAEGVGHIITHFKEILENHGVEVIEALGETFDPNIHEALAQMPGEVDNLVVNVHEKGYKLNGKLLRPARVVISKAPKS